MKKINILKELKKNYIHLLIYSFLSYLLIQKFIYYPFFSLSLKKLLTYTLLTFTKILKIKKRRIIFGFCIGHIVWGIKKRRIILCGESEPM